MAIHRATLAHRIALVAVLATAGGSVARAAVDPFYVNLAERGKLEADQGLHGEAVRHLQLACFGMLEEPRELAACLVALALAQADAGDPAAFAATFARLVEVERRFSGLRQARVSDEDRRRFEELAGERIEYEVLAAVPILRDVARRQKEREIAALPRDARRREVEARLAAEPDDLGWRVLAAELALADGDAGGALVALDALLTESSELERALCLRAVARAELGRCPEALADLSACTGALAPDWLRPLLSCAVDTREWQRASELLAEVPAEERRRSPYRRWARRIDTGLEEEAREAATAEDAPENGTSTEGTPPEETDTVVAGDPPPAETTVSPDASEPPAPPPSDPAAEAELRDLRSRLAGATTRAELEAIADQLAAIAAGNPGLAEAQQMVGEVAYRLGRWEEAVGAFERTAPLPASRPELGFYYAVALYETGRREDAAVALEAVLPRMRRTPFVDSYAERILVGEEGAGGEAGG